MVFKCLHTFCLRVWTSCPSNGWLWTLWWNPGPQPPWSRASPPGCKWLGKLVHFCCTAADRRGSGPALKQPAGQIIIYTIQHYITWMIIILLWLRRSRVKVLIFVFRILEIAFESASQNWFIFLSTDRVQTSFRLFKLI